MTLPPNLAEIVEKVKPTYEDFVLTARTDVPWTAPDPDYVWVCNYPDGGQAFSYTTPDAAYAACVVALLGRCEPYVGLYTSDGGKFAVEYNDVCQTDGYDDPLSALYAAFIARPDLFGETA